MRLPPGGVWGGAMYAALLQYAKSMFPKFELGLSSHQTNLTIEPQLNLKE